MKPQWFLEGGAIGLAGAVATLSAIRLIRHWPGSVFLVVSGGLLWVCKWLFAASEVARTADHICREAHTAKLVVSLEKARGKESIDGQA